MDIIQAVNRIGWRFGGNGNKNPFPVNEKDLEAFNAIIKVVKEHQDQQFQQNQLFAKLYIFVYMRFISKMEATVMHTEPRKAMHKILERPIERWIEDFKNEMNDSEMYEALKQSNIEIKHPLTLTDEEKKQNSINVSQNKETLLKAIKNVWDYDTVKDCLEIEINNALNLNKW